MPTVDDLRAAMNELATTTAPLPGAETLRRARRRHTGRQVFTYAGAAVAVLAATTAVALGPWRPAADPDGRNPPALASAPAATPSTSTGAPVEPRDQRFAFGEETKVDQGVFSTTITDRSLPPEIQDTAYLLHRVPNQTRIPAYSKADGTLRYLHVGGVEVRVTEQEGDGGLDHQLEWITNRTLYVLMATAARADDDKVYGPTDDDLRWLVQRISRK